MKNRNPFEWLSPGTQKRVFVALLLLTLVVMGALRFFDNYLKTEAAPAGIVSFEFAGSLTSARHITASWGPEGSVYAGLSLGLDFLFLFTYAGTIGLGCVLAAHALPRHMQTLSVLGPPLAWGQLCAALLDVFENVGLIHVLLGAENEFWPFLAYWCALPKFLIVAAGLLYLTVCAVLLYRF